MVQQFHQVLTILFSFGTWMWLEDCRIEEKRRELSVGLSWRMWEVEMILLVSSLLTRFCSMSMSCFISVSLRDVST